MQVRKLLADDDAVSPVIGVILMVAITVILAAVIGTFVLGLGDQVQDTAPQTSFTFDYTDGTNEDTLEIVHDGGDSVPASNLDASVTGATDADGDPNQAWAFDTDLGASGDVTAGTSVTVDEANLGLDGTDDLDLSGSTVRVTWNADSADSSATLGKWSGPDA
jgi:flagellin-like protein